MRVLGALVVAAIMYVTVPYLWQREMAAKVEEISAKPPSFPIVAQPVAAANVDANNLVNAMYPQIDINTEEYERLGVQSAADDAMRRAQDAQDSAWRASHGEMP